jgi:ArsR family transcriptional regulator
METIQFGVEKTAYALKLLGDKTRLTIVALIKNQDCCVCELVELLKMSQPAVSQHLRKLRDVGIIQERRQGQWTFYSLNERHELYPMVQSILEYVPNYSEKLIQMEQAGLRINCK